MQQNLNEAHPMDSTVIIEANNHPQPDLDQKDQEQKVQSASCLSLFRFADRIDYLLMIGGTICALGMGAAMPAFALLWGQMTDTFNDPNLIVDTARGIMFSFFYIGIGAFVAGWGMFACWMITGERQGIACRQQYLKSLLRQQIGWFDSINQSQLSTKFTTDSFAFQGAIGEKVSTLIMTFSTFVTGFVIAFVKGWLMTLVVMGTLPFIAIGGALFAGAIASKDSAHQKDYAEAGGMAEQAITSIKTVKQLNGEQFEATNYSQLLKSVTKHATKHGLKIGAGIGAMFGIMLCSYALGFWYGSHCVQGTNVCPPHLKGSTYTAGDVLIVFFSILMAGFNLVQLSPAIKKITQGRAAAARIFKIIDREPLITSPPNPIIPQDFRGNFKFQNVSFAYPKDKSRKIFQNLTLDINNKSVAFVGESGCGKSTLFQLIMRFYDPDQGRILLDGVDLKDLDLNWLRNQIGYVGQEPVLFAMTLKQNLLFGKEDATNEQIQAALKKAQAFDFVSQLKDGLQTYAGTSGGQISGGQKQRIAIARALLKNPKILLLDEATSALDRLNQRLIQNTLNKIAQEKLTMTIAHRVKTIMNCHDIIVFGKGAVLERGKFNQLERYKKYQKEMQEDQIIAPTKTLKGTQKKGILDLTGQVQNTNTNVLSNGQEMSDQARKKQEQKKLVKKYEDQITGRLFSYLDRKCLFVLGIIVSAINGVIFPVFAIFLSKMLAVLVQFGSNKQQARKDANLYALLFMLIGIAAFVVNLFQSAIFSTLGQEMTQKIRNQTYTKILKMPIPWFDIPRNSSGGLSARLAADCKLVNGLVIVNVAVTFQNISTLLSAAIIALVFQWRTSLVALGLLPLMVIAGIIQMKFTTGFSQSTDAAYKQSSSLITEAMVNIRTVSSFGYQDIIQNKYNSKLVQPLSVGVKKGNVSGFLFGLSQLVLFIVFALIFYLGTIFLRDNDLNIADVFTAIYALVFAGMTAGNNMHFMSDVAEATNAAANIFQTLDQQDQDQLQVKTQSKMLKTPIKGNIQFKNVEFKYQSREQYVFKDFNLSIKQGQKVGFVGPSGCGKSTIHQLIQRFYEPSKGDILLQGVNIKDYDIHYLRSCIGVVSQQPILFDQTIQYNIKYNRQDLTRQQVVAAANQAYFNPEVDKIQQVVAQTKPKTKKGEDKKTEQETGRKKKVDGVGFQKNVGVKGSHISGGQKQRVAIARTIIRKPTLMLLDEATSALDRANQMKVQQSLDKIMANKTLISIAHRIETIENADKIAVFEKGQIVQMGTFKQLLQLKGHFYKLEKGLQFI